MKTSAHILFAFFIFLAFSWTFAESYEGHRKDACECLGYDKGTSEAQSTFDDIVRYLYQVEIDQYPNGAGPRITRIRDDFRKLVPDFTTGNYSHRIVFHNGFKPGMDFPGLSLAMRLQLSKAAGNDDWRQYESKLLSYFREEQTAFHRSIECKFTSVYGATITDDVQRNALIRIIYDIHLLGDYKESANDYTGGCLMEYFELEVDLCDALRKLGCGKTAGLENKIKATGSSDNKERAEHVLRVLKENLPSLIKKNPALREALWGKKPGWF